MKNSVIIIIVIIALVSCKGKTKTVSENPANTTDSVTKVIVQPTPDTIVAPAAKTTIVTTTKNREWEGTYKGTLPCIDCEGIETTLTIKKDMSFTMITKYLRQNAGVTNKQQGFMSWNSNGTVITLAGLQGGTTKYLVGDNMLIQLDMNGNEVTGPNASRYQLIKQPGK